MVPPGNLGSSNHREMPGNNNLFGCCNPRMFRGLVSYTEFCHMWCTAAVAVAAAARIWLRMQRALGMDQLDHQRCSQRMSGSLCRCNCVAGRVATAVAPTDGGVEKSWHAPSCSALHPRPQRVAASPAASGLAWATSCCHATKTLGTYACDINAAC